MIPIPTRTGILVAKAETTLGTPIALAAADAGFRVINPRLRPNGNSVIIPSGTGNGNLGTVTKMFSADLSFDLQLYTGIWKSIFLHSCGFDDTAVSGTYVFTDDATKWKSITAGLFYGSSAKRGTAGAMGSFGIKFDCGVPALASFKYKGIWLPNPGTLPTGITWETALPPAFDGANSLTIGADATVAVGTVELTSDDYAFLIPSSNVAGAYVNAWLKKPNHRIKVDPRTVSTKDYIVDWTSDTQTTITAVLPGGAGNTITMTATVAQVSAPADDEKDETLVSPLEFVVLNNSLSLAFS